MLSKHDINSRSEGALHIVNNGAASKAVITGLPPVDSAVVVVTNAYQNAEKSKVDVSEGRAVIEMPAESFITVLFSASGSFK